MRQLSSLKLSILFLLLPLMASISWADVPSTMNYQGVLTDSAGTKLQGSQMIIFSIYDDPAAGSEIWSEQQTVNIIDGMFNIQLGSVVPLSVTDFHTAELYLEIQVLKPGSGGGWEPLSPRQVLSSTAFSMKAGDADTLEGYGEADFARSGHDHDSAYVNTGEANTINSTMVAPNTLTAVDLAEDSVEASELADNAVDTNAIAAGAVTAGKIGPNAVGSGQIVNGSVLAADLADGAALAEIADDDGIGSGLNADLLDNKSSEAFADATHSHDFRYINSIGDDSMNGSLTVKGSLSLGTDSGTDNDYLYMDSGTAEWLRWENARTWFQFSDALNILTGSLTIGSHTTPPVYNSIGSGTPISGRMNNSSDLYVRYDIEAGDSIYAQHIKSYGEIEADGDVTTTGNFKYKTPKTFYLNIPACAFVKRNTSNTVWASTSVFKYTSSGTTNNCYAIAPVYLPAGATITKIQTHYYDDSSTLDVTISMVLLRIKYDGINAYNMADQHATSFGSSNDIRNLEESSISAASIDNQYKYQLEIHWDPTGFSQMLRFYGARITYTMDTVTP
ncbi:MAG: hypothetical protein DRQ58_09185 [Gammaproteobacteria bacterium]|nr:MAG: hypothetical protein DRQ58_09185 [Gammaproteobacteria bacterium]